MGGEWENGTNRIRREKNKQRRDPGMERRRDETGGGREKVRRR